MINLARPQCFREKETLPIFPQQNVGTMAAMKRARPRPLKVKLGLNASLALICPALLYVIFLFNTSPFHHAQNNSRYEGSTEPKAATSSATTHKASHHLLYQNSLIVNGTRIIDDSSSSNVDAKHSQKISSSMAAGGRSPNEDRRSKSTATMTVLDKQRPFISYQMYRDHP